MNFKKLYKYIGQVASEIFPEATPTNHIMKMKQEADEVIQEPTDMKEYADCLFAFIAAANKAGFTQKQLIKAARSKANINRSRIWVKLEDGTHQHLEA